MAKHRKNITKISIFATLLALLVIGLGTYTRLTDSGLGCPDWPGCYGQIAAPTSATSVAKANAAYPESPVVVGKAWREMTHRYVAGGLGLVIIVLGLMSAIKRDQAPGSALAAPLLLIVLVLYQALLGLWTVTWQLLPLVVMAHLLGGMLIISLLWYVKLRSIESIPVKHNAPVAKFRFWAMLGLVILAMQVALGAWTSANYASLVCPDFPTCHGTWAAHYDFKDAFNFLSHVGIDYQGGLLGNSALMTIQMVHRLGALITTLYLGILSVVMMFKAARPAVRRIALMTLVMLVIQVTLGIMNVVLSLPTVIGVAHSLGAAGLLIVVVTMNYRLYAENLADVGGFVHG